MKTLNERDLKKFGKDALVLPLLIVDENNVLIEAITCTSISGGKDYANNMPKRLTLVRKQKSSKIYTATYIQDEIGLKKALLFVKHLESHLKDLEIEGKVLCKICGKTIDEIYAESEKAEDKGEKT